LYCSLDIVRGEHIKADEMGRACGTYGWRREMQYFDGGNLKERDHLVDQSVDVNIVLN
jgi:hypothetical protein